MRRGAMGTPMAKWRANAFPESMTAQNYDPKDAIGDSTEIPPSPVAGDPEARFSSRSIRSFVLRQGRMTVAQQHHMEETLPKVGIPYRIAPLELDAAFGRTAPKIVEIGFGMGETTAKIAAALPEKDFLGIEVHGPGVGSLCKQIAEGGLNNLRIMQHDAVERRPPVVLDLGVALALVDVAVDAALGAEPGTVLPAQPLVVELQQRGLARHRGEIELAVDDRIGVLVDQFDLIQLVDFGSGDFGQALQASPTRCGPRCGHGAAHDDAVVQRFEFDVDADGPVQRFVVDVEFVAGDLDRDRLGRAGLAQQFDRVDAQLALGPCVHHSTLEATGRPSDRATGRHGAVSERRPSTGACRDRNRRAPCRRWLRVRDRPR